ncbi:MAG: hypothetical protein ACRENZ_06815 [Thermodesulfobacteriota bacterium]
MIGKSKQILNDGWCECKNPRFVREFYSENESNVSCSKCGKGQCPFNEKRRKELNDEYWIRKSKTKVRCFKASDILFGFTQPNLREDHAIITLQITLPIKERDDAYKFVDEIKSKIEGKNRNE